MVSLKRQLEQYVRVFPKGTLQAKEQRGPLLDQLSPTTTQILHEKEWTSLSDFLPEHEMDLSEAQKFIVSNVFASSTDIRCHVISLIRREFALQRTMDFLAFTLYDIEADSRRFVDTHLRVTECLFWLDQVHIQCSCHGHETMILVVESKWVRLSDVKKRLCSPSFFELSDASLFCLMHGDLLLNDSAFLGDQTFYLDNGELWIDLLLFEDSKCDSRHSVPEEMHSPRIPNVVLKDICSLPQCQLVPRAGGRLERFSDLIASVDNTVSFRETCGLGRGIFQGFVQQFYGEGDYEALKGQLRGNLSQAVEKKKREELRRVKESEHGRVLTILGKVVEELQSNAEHYVGGEVTTSDLDELCEHLEVFLYTLSAAIKERSAESKDTHKTGIPLLMFDFSVDDVIFRCLSKLFRCIIVLFDFQKCTKMIYGEGKKSIGFLRWDGSHYDSVMFSKSVDDLLKVPSLEYHVERDTKRPKLVTRPVAKGEVASPHRNTSNDFKRPEKMGPFQRFVAENDQMLAQWDGPERQARAFEMWGKLDAQEKKRYRDEHLDMLEQSSGLKKHRDAKDNREAEIVEEDVMLWDSEDVEHDPPPKKYRTDNGEVQ